MTDRKKQLEMLATSFVHAFNNQDAETAMFIVADDAVFEDPRGGRHAGKDAIRKAFAPLFDGSLGSPYFSDDDLFIDADTGKVAASWELQITVEGESKRLRGVDLLHFCGQKLTRKLTYVKAETPLYLN